MFWALKRTVLLISHNMCFGCAIRNLIFWYALLTEVRSIILYLWHKVKHIVLPLTKILRSDVLLCVKEFSEQRFFAFISLCAD